MKTTLLCSFCDDAIDIGDTVICKNCVDELHKNIKKLQSRIVELEMQAVVWHKYPDKKPVNGRYYITYNGKNVEAHFWRGGAEYWADMASSEDDIIINKVHDITHWAYLPNSPEVKG